MSNQPTEDFLSGRNDGNSGSPETRRVTEFNGDNNGEAEDTKGANQADGKADGKKQTEEDIELERQSSGE